MSNLRYVGLDVHKDSIVMSFRGIQLLCATVIAAEIGDLRRFKSAWQFMAFLVEAA